MSKQLHLKAPSTFSEKKVFYITLARATLMGVALVATIWVIGALNSGTLFAGGENSTAVLLGIPASRH